MINLNVGEMTPAMAEAAYQAGASPRDTEFNKDVWKGLTVEEAVGEIRRAGFEPAVINPDPRFRAGDNNWWVTDDPANYVMPDPKASAGAGCSCGKHA